LLSLLIPIDAQIVGLPADGHNVDSAGAVDVCGSQVFDRDSAVIDNVPGPFCSFGVKGLVNAHAAPFTGFVAEVIAHADD